jgi:eukaryotic-like serine/threonine-protein kinase
MSDAAERPSDLSTRDQSPTDVERQTPRPLFAPGDRLPNLEMWVLERRLGGGGFGEVWLARHEWKDNHVAVKFCTHPEARHKLVTHERTVVARVMKHCGNHPNVVPMLECNLSGDIPWLMYEFVEGGTLAEAIDQWRELPPPRRLGRAVRTLHALAGALGTFHRLDPPLVHRDLKPQNVLMAGSTPRITDFGIGGAAIEAAKSNPEVAGSDLAVPVPTFLHTFGSSAYAPQEQFLGSLPSPRDDVFALGVIAYQLILADLKAVPDANAASELRALRIPSELVTLIIKSVALDPMRRPKDATEWENKLAKLMKKKTVAPQAPTPAEDASGDDPTEELEAVGDSEVTSALVSQTLDITARGRWYSRPAGQPDAEWVLVAKTPAEVRIGPGAVYRFSINSSATEADTDAIRTLAGLTSLRYLNLSYCAGVTDAVLAHLPAFIGVRQLFLRGCSKITDAGLLHLHRLANLHTLELTDSGSLTAAGIAALQTALPKCKILH